ncbi:hypothetical protein AKJ16_DCAP27317 [Drosera capensis]
MKIFRHSDKEAGDVSSISANGWSAASRKCVILLDRLDLVRMATSSFSTRAWIWLLIMLPRFLAYSDADSCPNNGC